MDFIFSIDFNKTRLSIESSFSGWLVGATQHNPVTPPHPKKSHKSFPISNSYSVKKSPIYQTSQDGDLGEGRTPQDSLGGRGARGTRPVYLVQQFQSPGAQIPPALCFSHRNHCCLWSSSAACLGGRSHHQSCLCRRQLEEEKEVRDRTKYSLKPNHPQRKGADDPLDASMDVLLHVDVPTPPRPQLGSPLLLTVTISPQSAFTCDDLLTLISLHCHTTPEVISLSAARVPHGLISSCFAAPLWPSPISLMEC